MKDLVKGRTATERDTQNFDPTFGPCCGVDNFRLHLAGTPCNPWNKSATDVFIESFLEKYTEYSSDNLAVVRMVKFKTHSTIAAMIKQYRITGPGGDVDDQTRRYNNRQERKRKVLQLPNIPAPDCGLLFF